MGVIFKILIDAALEFTARYLKKKLTPPKEEEIVIAPDPIPEIVEEPIVEEPPKKEQVLLYILDNGHGELTAGKRSPELNGVRFYEYEFNRDIVRRIGEILEEKQIKYVNLVPEVHVGNFLKERVKRANAIFSEMPKLYVSIHSNAAPASSINAWADSGISGVEVWYHHSSEQGRQMAEVFLKHIVEKTGWKNRGTKSQTKGEFYVLRKTDMVAILTENGFYNNKEQMQELMKDEVRQAIAEAHVEAILEIEEKFRS